MTGELGPARKRTGFLFSCWPVVEEIRGTCNGEHDKHNHILEGRAKHAEVYLPALCQANCRGIARQKLRDETGNCSSGAMSRRQFNSMMSRARWKDDVHEEDGGCDQIGTKPQDGRALLKEEMEAYDDVTVANLDPMLVKKARLEEMAFFRK